MAKRAPVVLDTPGIENITGKPTDLGVRYLLDGSVRRAGELLQEAVRLAPKEARYWDNLS
ncbi:MAG: hypothetical protein WBH85_01090 [Thermoanaerobaculia bacterium]